MPFQLELPLALPLVAHNGGLFISRGAGTHPERVIDSHELIVVRSGVLHMEEEGEPFRVGPGTALILYPGRRHRGAAPYPLDLSFYWIHFAVAGGNAAPVEKTAAPPLVVSRLATVADAEKLCELCTRFLDEQESGGAVPGNPVSNLLLLLILAEIARGRPAGAAPPPLAARARDRIRVQCLSPHCTAGRLAADLRCNPDYLGRLFRDAYGRSLTDEIHAVRVLRARRLLLETPLEVKEVARDCGFGDIAFFRKVFRRHTGAAPAAFRRRHGNIHVNTE